MAFPALIGMLGGKKAIGSALLGGLGKFLGGRSGRKERQRAFQDQMRLMQEQARLARTGYESPWRKRRWEGQNEIVTLTPRDRMALDEFRDYRTQVMANWNPDGGWYDDGRGAEALAKALEGAVQPSPPKKRGGGPPAGQDMMFRRRRMM